MNGTEVFAYMMAAEKMISMLSLMEQTIEFLEEYKIKPDDEVRRALNPLIERMKNWTKIDGKPTIS